MRIYQLDMSVRKKFNYFKDMQVLGTGLHAKVYTDGKYAYKLCEYHINYIGWIKYLKDTGMDKSPAAPKIISLYVDKRKRWCVVKMEKLEHLHDDWDTAHHSNKFEKARNSFNKIKKGAKIGEFQKVANNVLEFIAYKGSTTGNYPSLDIHGHNIMMRGNQLVITDPIV